MNYVYIGNIVNTHGIKGEVRILSSFNYKEYIFKKNFNLYIGKNKEKQTINSYRFHKIFDMVTFYGIDNINDVLKYKGEKVYILREDIKENIILDEDLIGLECYTNKYIGSVSKILNNKMQDIIVVKNNDKEILIPKVDAFIKNIDLENKKIYINEIEGLIDED